MQGAISATILDPYAEALMSLAQSQNLTDQFGEDTKAIQELLENSTELAQFLASPIIKADDKKAVIKKVIGEAVHPYLINFLMILVDRRRIVYLAAICDQYQTLLRKLQGKVLAEVTSAVALNEGQIDSIRQKVLAMTSANDVDVVTTIDPSILGGVIIKVGSQVVDSSLRGQLRRIGISLAK